MEAFIAMIDCGLLLYLCHVACVLIDTLGKCYIAKISKDLTDTQIKSLCKMMSKSRKFKFFH